MDLIQRAVAMGQFRPDPNIPIQVRPCALVFNQAKLALDVDAHP